MSGKDDIIGLQYLPFKILNINAFLSYILRTANYIEAKDNLKRLLIYGIKQNQGDEYFKLTNDKDQILQDQIISELQEVMGWQFQMDKVQIKFTGRQLFDLYYENMIQLNI